MVRVSFEKNVELRQEQAGNNNKAMLTKKAGCIELYRPALPSLSSQMI